MSFAAMAHAVEGLCLHALFTLKEEISLICLAGAGLPTLSMMGWQFILL
jgi:hypothetical protein